MSEQDIMNLPASTFFGLDAKGKRICYLLDRSTATSQKDFVRAKIELLRSIESFDERYLFYIGFFSDQGTISFRNNEQQYTWLTRQNVQEVFDWIRSIDQAGGPSGIPPVEIAFKLKADVLYLLSNIDLDAKFIATHSAINSIAIINAASFGNAENRKRLRDFARNNRGYFVSLVQE
ncbi:MAG TPA: hypothetical protein PKD64_11775 [Pirellulaceae bacterium]|nr:hypothetical protein [Pirellulaceae bacterium]HMO92863.1 hypothetical protein [Pirellulaceae bacterium]HMP71104.1 hypothetical protein [Pirellulaceae bacterium]